MKFQSRLKAILACAGTAALLFTASPAMAASPPTTATELPDDVISLLESEGVDVSLPGVQEAAQELVDSGAEIIGGTTVMYEPENSSSKVMAPMVFPSGCGLTVLMSRSGRVVSSSSLTACNSGSWSSARMENGIMFWAWLQWNVLGGWKSKGVGPMTSFTLSNSYTCVNGNSTEFRTETYGELVKGGTRYTAAAYDIFDAGAQPCGTS